MARPSPAPPYSRAGELSACRKSSKTRSWSSGSMPMPVSVTAIATSLAAGRGAAATVTDPLGVNLIALVTRLRTICLTFGAVAGDRAAAAGPTSARDRELRALR